MTPRVPRALARACLFSRAHHSVNPCSSWGSCRHPSPDDRTSRYPKHIGIGLGMAALSIALIASLPVRAESVDFVVTPTRTPTPIARAGSAVTVIGAEEIARANPRDVSDLLRRVPGVTVTQAGGAGATQTVRMRGQDSRHTLVLVDGIRVNDPSTPTGEFDFASLVLSDVERIEVLRGPQSALYGSDAVGGVINIITRKGQGAPKGALSVEGGSYGTRAGRANVSGSYGRLSYSFGLSGYETTGFSRYGYRIRRIANGLRWPLEADGATRTGATGRLAYNLAEGWDLEIGGHASANRSEFDAAFAPYPDTPSLYLARLAGGHARLTGESFGGLMRHALTVFGNETRRESQSWTYFGPLNAPFGSRTDFGYRGAREGVEYQGDLRLGAFGTFIAGTKMERERFRGDSQAIAPMPALKRIDDKASQITRSAFALHQVTLAERLHLSLGGRIDDVIDADRFVTWRGTLAYEVPETETKFRASAGTGGKAPGLYQLYSRLYGTRTLESERSFGVDAGIDQSLFEGRVKLSGTIFANRYRNFIDFAVDPRCRPDQIFGCYVNVARAETSGFEGEASLDLVPQWLKLRATYTYLQAFDRMRDKRLTLRPEHEGRLGFTLTPLAGLTLEPVVTIVGPRYSAANEQQKLKAYARLDLLADYKVTDTLSLFARAENLTDARYQEIRDYGAAGRSLYGGMRASW